MPFQYHQRRTFSRDSDFPRTFSWSTSLDTEKGRYSLPYTQSTASEILRFEDFSGITPPITVDLDAVLDRTTLDIEFDRSCLDGLDDELLYRPADAFTAMCWAEAVDEQGHPHDSFSGGLLGGAKIQRPLESSSDESDSDSEECRTFNDDILTSLPVKHGDDTLDLHSQYSAIYAKKFLLNRSLSSHEEQAVPYETRFTRSVPTESIGLFPVPSARKSTNHTFISAFRAYLPIRLGHLKPTVTS
ncbi:hypothetical protein Hypma_007982 [Hypsizygus marmoreus]|uniref:Uncharacterized protein n=1 Tax=Hypsizygus marmoreus TaxID=39966 RepID=A0A369JXR5_HYPMA|nr:hypothetical protein Hypma_007982 [Hypsizygus marmoreus]